MVFIAHSLFFSWWFRYNAINSDCRFRRRCRHHQRRRCDFLVRTLLVCDAILAEFSVFPRARRRLRFGYDVTLWRMAKVYMSLAYVLSLNEVYVAVCLTEWDCLLVTIRHSSTRITILAERIAIGLEFNLILFSPFHSTKRTHTNIAIYTSTLSIGVHVYNCTVRFGFFLILPSSSLQYFISISIFHSSVVVAWFLVANKVLSLHSQSQCARDVRTITTTQHIVHLAERTNWDMPRANSCDCHT